MSDGVTRHSKLQRGRHVYPYVSHFKAPFFSSPGLFDAGKVERPPLPPSGIGVFRVRPSASVDEVSLHTVQASGGAAAAHQPGRGGGGGDAAAVAVVVLGCGRSCPPRGRAAAPAAAGSSLI